MKLSLGLWLGGSLGSSGPEPGPTPGPLDFGSGDYDQTSYTTAFDVAAPHVVMGMYFYYTGNPEFTVTHEGEQLEGRVQLNGGRGCLLFIGDHLTVETGALEISCTGGTFGPFYGRVNEMPFEPDMNRLDWITVNFLSNNHTFNHSGGLDGRIYGIVATSWWTGIPRTTPLQVRSACRDIYGPGVSWTPGPNGFNWTWNGDVATHTGQAINASFPSEMAAEVVGPYRFRCTISDFTDPPTTHSVQYRNATGTSGANANLQRYGNTLTGLWTGLEPYKKFELRMNNDVTVSDIRVYNSSVPAYTISGVIASADNNYNWYYSSTNNMQSAAISLKVYPVSTDVPVNTVPPSIVGDLIDGNTVTMDHGGWV